MKRHVAGKTVRSARVTEIAESDVPAIGEATRISPSQFASLIGTLRKLPNWEQRRTRPTGPARAAEDRGVEPEVGDRGTARRAGAGYRNP